MSTFVRCSVITAVVFFCFASPAQSQGPIPLDKPFEAIKEENKASAERARKFREAKRLREAAEAAAKEKSARAPQNPWDDERINVFLEEIPDIETPEDFADFHEFVTAYFDEEIEYTKYSSLGYPMCQDIMKVRSLENQLMTRATFQLVRANLDEEMAMPNYLSELGFAIPSESMVAKHLMLSDRPEHPIYFERPSISDGKICFVAGTKVIGLSLRGLEEGATATDVLIKDVKRGSYILSSTAGIINDPRFHQPCWSRVEGLMVGEIRPGEKFHDVEISNGDRTIDLRVTPKHRFFANPEAATSYDWLPIADLPGYTELYSLEGGDAAPVRILHNKPKEYQPNSGGCGGDRFMRVYNLTLPHTFSYYVGGLKLPVLVHNGY